MLTHDPPQSTSPSGQPPSVGRTSDGSTTSRCESGPLAPESPGTLASIETPESEAVVVSARAASRPGVGVSLTAQPANTHNDETTSARSKREARIVRTSVPRFARSKPPPFSPPRSPVFLAQVSMKLLSCLLRDG